MMYDSASGRVTLAFAGEAMITRALRPFREPRFLALAELLRASDATIANAEMLFHDFEGAPAYRSATWMRCDPQFIADLQWFGIDMVGTANNHAFDYGETGLLTSLGHLSAAGLPHAGSGRDRAEAVAPAYLDTPGGRVALIAATTSGRQYSRAGEQRPDLHGRPGTNLLRWNAEWRVDDESFRALARVAEEFGWNRRPPGDWTRAFDFAPAEPDDVTYFWDRTMFPSSDDPVTRFVRSEDFGISTRLHQADLERNFRSIRDAKRMADWVVFSVHNHEFAGSVEVPSEHVVALAHTAIDAGADVVLGHGPHRDRGIEIYEGKPIFYSLGNFIAQNNTVQKLPQDALDQYGLGLTDSAVDLYDAREKAARRDGLSFNGEGAFGQSAVAVVSFDAHELTSVELHPIDLGMDAPRSQAGRPMIAEGDTAAEVLARFATMSEPFGTSIEIAGDRAAIRI